MSKLKVKQDEKSNANLSWGLMMGFAILVGLCPSLMPPSSPKVTVIPNYDIEKEIWSIDNNVEQKMSEVSQVFRKWKETSNDTIILNHGTDQIEIRPRKVVEYLIPEIPKLPIPDPRNDHLEPYVSSETKYWTQFLIEQKQIFTATDNVFIEGAKMRQILKHIFEATDIDLDEFEHASDNMNHDPFLSFRKMAIYRLGIDLNLGTARRLSREPYILTEKDGIKGINSGMTRFFGEVQDWVLKNSAFQGLMRLQVFFMNGNLDLVTLRPGIDGNRNFNNIGDFHRVMSLPNLVGNPTIEGVHQDGVEFIFTTFLKSSNVDFDHAKSATTQLVTLDQPIGTSFDDVNQTNVIRTIQHRNYLDTIFFIDTAMSHVVSPIHALNKEKPAYRDIFGNKMRHLAKANGEFSMAQFDNEKPHQRLPCVFGIYTKHLANHYSDYNYANGENPGKV